MRRVAAYGLVLLVHGALLLLLLYGHRARPQQEPSIAFVSIWAEPRLPERLAEPPPISPRRRSVASTPSPPSSSASEPVEAAITAPVPVPESTAPPIDWRGEAAAAAGRQGSRTEGTGTFSPEPKTARKPCKPPKSSFEWNPEEKRAGLAPLPYVRLGKRCVAGLGFLVLGFGCTLGKLPEANGKLFDDLKEGKAQESSVPDPDHCD